MKKIFSLFLALTFGITAMAQTIRGEVVDALTGEPLTGAHVSVVDEDGRSVVADIDGKFAFLNLPIKRHSIQASFIGFDPVTVNDLMVSTAKETVIRIEMQESQSALSEIVVKPKLKKEAPLNAMMLAGGRQLSVEEASRYAGGFDDPARLVNCFAGISTTGAENAISVHGNAPHTVQWHVEGVEIPAPNHISDAYSLGGGLISALSSQVMGNSDFAYSAFPAEYGNALGGLMDMQLRSGSDTKYEHSVGAGLLGLEAQSEGPMGKNGASYLFNYRYSLLGLANKIGISTGGNILNYQDLNFVLNMPTRSAGTFKFFGTAWQDHAYVELEDPDEWENVWDQNNIDVKQLTAIVGISNRYQLKGRGFIKTTLATALQQSKILDEYALFDNYPSKETYKMHPYGYTKKDLFDLTFSSVYQRRFNKRVLLKTGINLIRHDYSVNVHQAESILPTNTMDNLPLTNNGDFKMLLAEAFASTNVNITDRLVMNAGVFGLWNTDNGKTSIDPRISFRYDMGSAGQISLGYGLHSMLERMEVLAVVVDGKNVNRDLDFTRSHQLMLSWGKKLGENHNIKLDTYYQQHFDVAVGIDDNAGFSMLNVFDIYFDKQLVNKGKGRNYGIDLTLERYLKGGFYWMVNGSLFRSEYAGIDGRWHHTRFDRGWMAKALVGKEWIMGRKQNKVLNVSGKVIFMGGLRYSPIDEAASIANPDYDVVYDYTRAFECQNDMDVTLDLTVSYKVNGKKTANEIGLKWLNVLNEGNYLGHVYNYKKDCFEPYSIGYTFPNLYYRLYF